MFFPYFENADTLFLNAVALYWHIQQFASERYFCMLVNKRLRQ